MDSDDNLASRLMAAIAALPPEAQANAVHEVLSGVLKQLPTEGLLDVREEIEKLCEQEDLDIVHGTLDMIDGQIALRQIGGAEGWR